MIKGQRVDRGRVWAMLAGRSLDGPVGGGRAVRHGPRRFLRAWNNSYRREAMARASAARPSPRNADELPSATIARSQSSMLPTCRSTSFWQQALRRSSRAFAQQSQAAMFASIRSAMACQPWPADRDLRDWRVASEPARQSQRLSRRSPRSPTPRRRLIIFTDQSLCGAEAESTSGTLVGKHPGPCMSRSPDPVHAQELLAYGTGNLDVARQRADSTAISLGPTAAAGRRRSARRSISRHRSLDPPGLSEGHRPSWAGRSMAGGRGGHRSAPPISSHFRGRGRPSNRNL